MKIANAETGYINRPARRKKIAEALRKRSTFVKSDIEAIRLSSEPRDVLAERYGVTRETVRDIQTHQTWRDISGNPFAGMTL